MKKIPFSPPDMTMLEADGAKDAILSGWITTGPRTKEFERMIAMCCQTERAACLNSATACLEMALRVLGIGQGDEVIVPAYTYTASCSPICHVGATPVIIDCAMDSYEPDYDRLPSLITPHTKAVIGVDIAGIIADYDKIIAAADSKKQQFSPSNELQESLGRVAVIADSAHGFGAQRCGKMSGQVADFTSFSFHAVKNLTTAEGGALTWNKSLVWGGGNELIYRKIQLLSLHGQSTDALAKTQLGAWEYDIVAPYYKCNMTDITAAIGLAQLKRYSELLHRRRQIINLYDNGFKNHQIEKLEHFGREHSGSGHLYLTRLAQRDSTYRNEVICRMAERGIACNVHYKPLPMMTAYKRLGFDINDFPNAYRQFENEITLPLHTLLSDEDVEYVITNYLDIITK